MRDTLIFKTVMMYLETTTDKTPLIESVADRVE